nr:GAF domain-containing protein [Henriciella barbarensis]
MRPFPPDPCDYFRATARRPWGIEISATITDMRDATFKETPMDRAERYAELKLEIESLVSGETYVPARYASAACLLAEAFRPRFFWTGFYVVDPQKPEELVVGPYQGTLGCLRIPFGKGVCGACAANGETQLVPDVHIFPGHIACDSRSNSEIVVPVFDADGKLAAVLDVDSTEFDAFDEVDREGLEAICKILLTA